MLLIFSIMRVCVLCAQDGGKWFCEAQVCMVAAMVIVIKKKIISSTDFWFCFCKYQVGRNMLKEDLLENTPFLSCICSLFCSLCTNLVFLKSEWPKRHIVI